MFPQVARDVLKDFQGNQDGEQISKNFDEPITQPIGISIGVNQRKTDPNGELDQGRHNHHGCDNREQLGYLLLCGVDEQQEGSTLTTGLAGVVPAGFSILVLQVIDPSSPVTQSVGTTVLPCPERLLGPSSHVSD
jgi:hypothetical protein